MKRFAVAICDIEGNFSENEILVIKATSFKHAIKNHGKIQFYEELLEFISKNDDLSLIKKEFIDYGFALAVEEIDR